MQKLIVALGELQRQCQKLVQSHLVMVEIVTVKIGKQLVTGAQSTSEPGDRFLAFAAAGRHNDRRSNGQLKLTVDAVVLQPQMLLVFRCVRVVGRPGTHRVAQIACAPAVGEAHVLFQLCGLEEVGATAWAAERPVGAIFVGHAVPFGAEDRAARRTERLPVLERIVDQQFGFVRKTAASGGRVYIVSAHLADKRRSIRAAVDVGDRDAVCWQKRPGQRLEFNFEEHGSALDWVADRFLVDGTKPPCHI